MRSLKARLKDNTALAGAVFLCSLAVFALLAYTPRDTSHLPQVRADAGALIGYAWSDNIGWISFSGTASNGSPYGVSVGNDYTLSGYAWSDVVGWINFGPNSCGAQATFSNGALSGWAHVVVAVSGWDGCIKLADAAAPAYGAVLSGSDLTGYAWGSDTVGWISFNCLTGGGDPVSTYFTSSGTWTVPVNWNSANNTIEVIGGGANGTAGNTGGTGTTGGTPAGVGGTGGAGGGGGAYSKSTNVTLTPGATVSYVVGGVGGDSYFCNSTSNCTSIGGSAVRVGAKGGSGASGGAAASGVGTTKYNGGNGASGSSGTTNGGTAYIGGTGGNGGGGGGAAGLHGAGSGGSGASGGAGDAGYTSAGANGTQWSASYGSGGGAAAGSTGGTGGNGNGNSTVNGTAGAGGSAGGYYGAGGGGGKGGGGGSSGYNTSYCDKFTCYTTNYAGGTGGAGGAAGAGRGGIIRVYYAPIADTCSFSNYKVSYTGATTTPACTLSVSPNPAATNSSITFAYTTTGSPSTGVITDPSNNTVASGLTSPSGNVGATAPSTAGSYTYTMTVGNAAGSSACQTSPALTAQVDVCTDASGIQTSLPSGCTGPTPSPSGVCIPSGYIWNGSSCTEGVAAISAFSGPSAVRKGNTATLTYTVANPPASCSITGNNGFSTTVTPANGVQGSVTTNAINAQTTFTLTCESVSAQTTVGIIPTFQEQ